MKENKTMHSYHNRMDFSSLSPIIFPLASRVFAHHILSSLVIIPPPAPQQREQILLSREELRHSSDKPGYIGETRLLRVYYKTFRQ